MSRKACWCIGLLTVLLSSPAAAAAQTNIRTPTFAAYGQTGADPLLATVLSATSTSASITGRTLDYLNFPVTASASRPLRLKTTTGLLLASAALCKARAGCKRGTGPAWLTVKPGYIRPGDRLGVFLKTFYRTAYGDLNAGSLVPVLLVYDFGPR